MLNSVMVSARIVKKNFIRIWIYIKTRNEQDSAALKTMTDIMSVMNRFNVFPVQGEHLSSGS